MSDTKPFRIGYIDFQLENYHANVYIKAFRGPLKDRNAVVAGCFALDAANGQAWAKKNDVPYFDDATAMNDAVDAYIVLSPGNPEKHLELCQRVFMFGKPTYVDKTFAPDLDTAKRIFELADKHSVPVQTTSALRYTNVQAYVRDAQHGALKHMIAWGGGSSFDEYAIHPVELVVSCMGAEASSIMRRGTGDYSQLLLNFANDRTAAANIYTKPGTDFAAGITTEKGTTHLVVEGSKLFVDAAAAILDFLKTGKPTINRNESLMIRKILDTAATPEVLRGFVKL